MPRKPKFKPEIRRVKLNPEQTVLTCDCYSFGSGRRAILVPGARVIISQDEGLGLICHGRFGPFHLVHEPVEGWGWESASVIS